MREKMVGKIRRIPVITLACLCLWNGEAKDYEHERYFKGGVEKVRVMSYNIFNGFNWRKDKDRQERFVAWIKERDPEILGLEELCGFTEESFSELAKRWGHPYAVILKEKGYPIGVSSKKPIEVKAKILKGFWHGLLHVKTYDIDVLATHLNPTSAAARNRESATIVEYIKKSELKKFLVMGDMNSHSPMDADFLESQAYQMTSNYGAANLLNGKPDYSIISHFLSVPMIDVCRYFISPEKRSTFPTPILMHISKHPDVRRRRGERIDYIFASPELAKHAVDAFIYNEGEPDYLSDHYPIAIDLLFE